MRFILEIEDNKEGKALMKFLSQLSFVKIGEAQKRRKKRASLKIDEIFGIWKDRDITKETLREKAWRV